MVDYDIDILMKNIIAIFIAYKAIIENENPILVIITLLIYILIIHLIRIFNQNNRLKRFIFIVQSIILFILIIKGYILSISLILIDLFRILSKKNIYSSQAVIIFALGFSLKDYENTDTLILISILILIFIINNKEYKEKIRILQKIDLNQRNEIKKLSNKILREKEYREQSLRTSILEERNIISTKLHDKIGHVISGTLLQLEATKMIMDEDNKKSKVLIDRSIQNLRNGMDDIRMTLRSIRPQEEELSINRLKKLLEDKLSNTRIKGKLTFSGDLDRIRTEIWVLFINILIEGSTNAIKYSKCNLFEVNISVLNKLVKFEIKDDGIGCINIKKGIGLNSMEEKIRELDGKIILDGEKGFNIIVLIKIGERYEN